MTVRIALLRAVNVGGTGKLAMAEVRDFFDTLGFPNARTLIQTGNVVFECDERPGEELEAFLEAEVVKRLGLDTAFFTRTPNEWDDLIGGNPYPEKAKDDPRRLFAMVLKSTPTEKAINALEEAVSGPERFRASGRHLYIDYTDGMGSSKLTNVLIERKLETRGTARNWNTVLRIADMAKC